MNATTIDTGKVIGELTRLAEIAAGIIDGEDVKGIITPRAMYYILNPNPVLFAKLLKEPRDRFVIQVAGPLGFNFEVITCKGDHIITPLVMRIHDAFGNFLTNHPFECFCRVSGAG